MIHLAPRNDINRRLVLGKNYIPTECGKVKKLEKVTSLLKDVTCPECRKTCNI